MATSDDEGEYDYSDDEYQFEDGDDDAMEWKPVVSSGDNPNAAPMAGTYLAACFACDVVMPHREATFGCFFRTRDTTTRSDAVDYVRAATWGLNESRILLAGSFDLVIVVFFVAVFV